MTLLNAGGLFGPLSLTALERDEFLRATAGCRRGAALHRRDLRSAPPSSTRCSRCSMNASLTTALAVRVPLLSAVAASNGGRSRGARGAVCRFLLRKLMTLSPTMVCSLLLVQATEERILSDEAAATPDQLRCALDEVLAAAPSVELPRWVALLLRDARSFVRELGDEALGGGYVSDRRLRRTMSSSIICCSTGGIG